MVIDTSIIIHISFREENWKNSLAWLLKQPDLVVSSASLVEAHSVIKHRNIIKPEAIDNLMELMNIRIIDFSEQQSIYARMAYSNYGKGQNSKAKLNFGDCLVYGLAKSRDEVLAFVGNDFNHTDLESVRFPLSLN